MERAAQHVAAFKPPPSAAGIWHSEQTDAEALRGARALRDRLDGLQVPDEDLAAMAADRNLAVALEDYAQLLDALAA